MNKALEKQRRDELTRKMFLELYEDDKITEEELKQKLLQEYIDAGYYYKSFDDIRLDGYKNKVRVKQLIDIIRNTNPYALKKGLYIQGDVGRGKTLLASCIFNHFINYLSVKFIKVGELMYKSREIFNGGDFNLDKYKEAEVLILDDLGVEKTTEFAEDILLSIIDYRYERQMPTFLTSNIPASKIPELYPKHGRRLESRLTGENAMCLVLTLDGIDHRK